MPENYDDYDQRGGMEDRGDAQLVQRAKNAVKGPAIALIVMGVLCLLGAGYWIVNYLAYDAAFDAQVKQALNDPSKSADEKKQMQDVFTKIKDPFKYFILSMGGPGLVVALLTILGGVKMMGLKARGVIYLAAILSMIPCSSACCLIGLPIGIWVIVVLGRPEVKAGFAAVARGTR